MPKAISRETLLSYSPAGIFSITGARLASAWTVRAISGNPISREQLMRIFSKKLSPNHHSRLEVIAKVKILSIDVDGATELQLLEHAYLKS